MSESKGLSRKGVLIDFLNNVDVERQKNPTKVSDVGHNSTLKMFQEHVLLSTLSLSSDDSLFSPIDELDCNKMR